MSAFAFAPAFILVFFLLILLCLEAGRRIGQRQLARDPEHARDGLGAIDGAVFGLLGLLIAFTFSGAAERYGTRRNLIVEETNAIGTAWLRIDLLAPADQLSMRENFRHYLDTRLAVYRAMPDFDTARVKLAEANRLQTVIWKQAIQASEGPERNAARMLLLPALNEMIDITTTRTVALKTHPPIIIYAMLVLLTLVSALLIGYGLASARRRSQLHILGYALVIVATIYLIVDFDFPRLGLIQVQHLDQNLEELRAGMD